jgi:hypothetical protein
MKIEELGEHSAPLPINSPEYHFNATGIKTGPAQRNTNLQSRFESL